MQVYLLTGRPGSGKTSLIKQVLSELELDAGGFYTEEIRENNSRTGFRLVTLDGQEATLAHTAIKSGYRVSRYGVDIGSLEQVGVPALYRAAEGKDLVVVDEIGKMELLSGKFRQAISDIFSSGKKVLGTILLNRHLWADNLKGQPQVKLIALTRENREQVLEELRRWLTQEV